MGVFSLFNAFLTQNYFGNSVQQYLFFLACVLGAVVLAKIAYFVFKNIGRALTAKTKNNLDDLLLEEAEDPIVVFIVLGGFYYGLTFLSLESGLAGWVNAALSVAVTLNAAWLVARLVDAFIVSYLTPLIGRTRSNLDEQLLPIARKVVLGVILFVALMTVLSNFGYDVTTIIAGLGIGGIAVALAAQDTLANMIAALTIFTDKPFKIGDAVNLGGASGIVSRIGLRSTRLTAFYGTEIIIPNKEVINKNIENYTKSKERRYDVSLGLAYDTSAAKMKKALEICRKVARETKGVKPECEARFKEFGDYALKLKIFYYITDPVRMFDIEHEINLKLKDEFDKAGIEFAYPTQTIRLAK